MATLQVNFYSECLNRQTVFNAVLPVGKRKGPKYEEKIFKTLYLLHGLSGNCNDWLSNTRIAQLAEARNIAVIMPSADNSFYVDNEKAFAMYGEFFGREIVQITREMFPLSGKREDTFIAGLSMGGYGAVRTGLKYHNTFGAVAGLSSALVSDPSLLSDDNSAGIIASRSYFESVFGDLEKLDGSDKDPKELVKTLKATGAEIPKIFLACGTEDYLIEHSRDFHKFLNGQNVTHTYEEGTGEHNWDFWNEYILKVLNWLPL